MTEQVFNSIDFINFSHKTFWDISGDNNIIFKSVNYFCKNLYRRCMNTPMNPEYACENSFLNSTSEYVRVFMCIFVYMYIFVTIFAGISILNVWLVSEYTFILSFLKSTLESVHVFMWAAVLAWKLLRLRWKSLWQ